VIVTMATSPAQAATRLPSDTVVSATLRARGRAAAVRAAGRRIPVRRGAAVRLEAVRTGGRLEVALGTRRWNGPARGGIRTRGPLRVRRVLATGDAPADLIAHRLLAVEPVLRGDWAPDGAAPSGRIRRTRDWKRGFYAGSLWRAIEAAPAARDALEPVAWRATRALWGGEGDDIHDVGFIFGEADGGALRVACRKSSADCRHAARSLRRTAATLHRLAAATPAGAIVVTPKRGCKACTGDELKVFIDSVMNMTPLLTGGTGQDRALAEHHLELARRELVRADGSTTQQLFLRASTGAITRKLGHDPLAPESTWARGQGWAIRGYAEAAQALGGPWVDVAERTADWIAARPAGVPGWDWNVRRTQANPGDTSAAAIAAAGLARLVALRCGSPAPVPGAERCNAWDAARERLLAAALRNVSTRAGTLGRFDGQRYLWDPSRRIDYRGEYFMGTVYLLEALAISDGNSLAATSPSTAAGASGASAAAAASR
jgi:hypothetical protein